MKKYFISALACAVALVSCVKENNAPEQIPGKGQKITISATIPADGLTKVAFAEDGVDYAAGLKLTWEEGDIITVIDAANSGNFSVFELTGGEGTANGVFSGDALTGATSYIIQYDNVDKGFNYSEQTQATDGSTSHLKYTARLEGVSEYESFTFSEAWATSKGGTFASSSVLRVRADIPMDIDKVQAVYIKADAPIFAGGNEIKVNITTPADAGESNILTVYANLPVGDQAIADGTGLVFQFQVSDEAYNKYTAYRKLGAMTLKAGEVNSFNIDCNTDQDITKYANQSAEGIGTAANPYLIGDQNQMKALMEVYNSKDAENLSFSAYVKLLDDVDMTGVEWISLNGSHKIDDVENNYQRAIFFDGNGKTIDNLTSAGKYASFVGVLNGEVKNVVFDNANISSTEGKIGVVAGYLGTTGITAKCHDITIKNATLSNTTDYVGGLAGIAKTMGADIDNCHVLNVQASGNFFIGGLLGCVDGAWTVKNCTSSGTVSSVNETSNKDICLGGLVGDLKGGGTVTRCSSSVTINQTKNGRDIGGLVGRLQVGTIQQSFATGNVHGNQRNVGGFVGCITNNESSSIISDCYSTGKVEGNAHSGGFVGLIEKGVVNISSCYSAGDSVSGNFGMGGFIGYQGSVSLTAEKCVAWSSAVTASSNGQTNWSSGAVIGVTHPNAHVSNCYRKPGMSLTVYCPPPSDDWNHPDIDGTTHPLWQNSQTAPFTWAESTMTAISAGSSNVDAGRWAYHGKIDANKTLSQLAATLEWDANVWDMNGSLPILKFE